MKAVIELQNEDEIRHFAELLLGITGKGEAPEAPAKPKQKATKKEAAPAVEETSEAAVEDEASAESEAPEENEAPAPAVATRADVLTTTKKFVATHGAPALKTKLSAFKLGNLGELKEEQYGAFLASLEETSA